MNRSAKLTTVPADPTTDPTTEQENGTGRSIRRDLPVAGPELTIEQARAAHGVSVAITRAHDDGVEVPCVADPGTWDADDKPTARADVVRAVRLCLTACPVLEACRAYLATEPPTGGICAGVYRAPVGDPNDGGKRAERLRSWAAVARAELYAELHPEPNAEQTGDKTGCGEVAA